MKIFFIYFIWLCILTTQQASYADNITPQNTIQNDTIVKKIPNNIDDKGKLYKLLYENSKSNNKSMISIIQWSIGLVATFILFLLGSQIFFNYKISKDEVNSIQSDIDEKILHLKLEVIEEVKKSTDKGDEERNKLIDSKMDSYKTSVKYTELQLDNLAINIEQSKAEIEQSKADIWNLRGVTSNALTYFINTAKLKIKNKQNPKITLGYIKDNLEKAEYVYTDTCEHLDELIRSIPPEYSKIQSQINDLYARLPQKDLYAKR